MKFLFNSTALTQPNWAPPDFGGGGDELPDDSDELNMLEGDPSNAEMDEDENESEEEEEISLDSDAFLNKLFGPDEADDDDNSALDEDDLEAGDSEAEQQRLAENMRNNIGRLSVPEDAIPDDFDPGDGKQLRELLTNVQRTTVQETIRIMWEPIAAAMQQTHTRMRAEIREAVDSGVGENNIKSLLAREIPNYNAPGYREIVNTTLQQARKKHRDPVQAVRATKRALLAMGLQIKPKSGGGGRMGSQRGGASASTNQVLDAFAALPSMVSNQQNRLRNRMTKTKK